MSTTIFAYGTLMYPTALEQLTGKHFEMVPATLHNHQRFIVARDDVSRVPVILQEPGNHVDGMLLLNIDDESLAILDDFEDSDMGIYEPVTVETITNDGRSISAQLYRGLEAARAQTDGIWEPTEFEKEALSEMVDVVIPQWLASR